MRVEENEPEAKQDEEAATEEAPDDLPPQEAEYALLRTVGDIEEPLLPPADHDVLCPALHRALLDEGIVSRRAHDVQHIAGLYEGFPVPHRLVHTEEALEIHAAPPEEALDVLGWILHKSRFELVVAQYLNPRTLRINEHAARLVLDIERDKVNSLPDRHPSAMFARTPVLLYGEAGVNAIPDSKRALEHFPPERDDLPVNLHEAHGN